jgi:hypothetical protein
MIGRGVEGKLLLLFEPSVRFSGVNATNRESLRNAFIAICAGSDFSITITGIKLEKLTEASAPPTEYTLTIAAPDAGNTLTATVDSAPVASGGSVEIGKRVTLTAIPETDYEFKNFVVGGVNYSGTETSGVFTHSFYMMGNRSVSAVFSLEGGLDLYELTFTQPSHGTLTVETGGNSVTSGAQIPEGEIVTLTATVTTATVANIGYEFKGFVINSETQSGNEDTGIFTYSFPMLADTVVSANIALKAGVLFEWDSTTNPITVTSIIQGNTAAANMIVTPVPGNPITFRARGDNPPGIRIINNALRLGNQSTAAATANRLIIGGGTSIGNPNVSNNNTTATLHIPGQFDLSEGRFRITVDYTNAVITERRRVFRFGVNCNTNEETQSILGGPSNVRVYNELPDGNLIASEDTSGGREEDIAEPGKITITFNPSVRYSNHPSLLNAFLVLHAQTSGVATSDNGITITGIKFEKLPD